MKVHVDINVVKDVSTQRAGWMESVAALKSLKPRGVSGFISALTMAIIHFQRLRKLGETQARADAKFVTKDFEIVPFDAPNNLRRLIPHYRILKTTLNSILPKQCRLTTSSPATKNTSPNRQFPSLHRKSFCTSLAF
ncbi:MAG: hypothetical protein ONB48_21155 [candidate division KSB1 bacterium]|nr:hypothetical protein [candidate division KSB1 bacterium]MDZ7288158.1 hypothetical protein [candidate division KSB1 bacterium]MDZ7300329.1 hypothetical protein [candidate division KSB1 bacterium]MDZ7351329.1 hypothetical protein [candidate division KSB1 bacterium]MDZ7355633.1 hypothetical protein [candidate division KSB1 bacterium]